MRDRIVAIECGPERSVVGTLASARDGALVLEEYALLPRDGASADSLWIAPPEAMRRASRIVATPPPHLTFVKHLEVPPLARAKRESVVRFEAAQAIPRPLTEVVWDWAPAAGGGNGVELAAMKLEGAEALAAAAARSGVRLDAIVARATALGRALNHNYPELGDTVVLAEVSGATALLVRGGRGGARARLVGLPERVAPVAAGGARSGTDDGNEPCCRRLALELARLSGGDDAAGAGAAATVWLLGGADAPEPAVVEPFAGPGAVRIERFDALRRVRLGREASGAAALAHQFGAVVGAALAVQGRRAPNLLPPARRRENVFRRRRVWWLAAAVGLVLLLGGMDLGLRREAARCEAEAAALETELEPWRAAQRRVAETHREIEACQRELTVVTGLERSRTSWVTFLADTQDRLTRAGGVWLETLELQPDARVAPGSGQWLKTGDTAGEDRVARLRIAVTGCALDPGPDGRRGLDRVRELLREWPIGATVAAVEGERFDGGEAGRLRFGCVLVLRPEAGL